VPDGEHDAMDFALGDVDGDARVDLVTFHPMLGEVHVRAGDGGGGFGAARIVALGKRVFGGRLRDLDGDGALDVVTEQSHHVGVMRGDGRGGFAVLPRVPASSTPEDAVFIDVDGDARLDYVASSEDESRLDVLQIGARGRLSDRRTVTCGEPTFRMTAGDFDGDGLGDVATRGGRASDVCVFRGGPNGLRPAARLERTIHEHDVGQIVALDVDGDGKDELALALWNSGVELYDLRSDDELVLIDALDAGHDARQGWAADVDGDGRDDLVLVNSGNPTFVSRDGGPGGYLNRGPASFTIARGRACARDRAALPT
jgi:hypothetical protein